MLGKFLDLAPSAEKEWYFYCPRDRKYKNSARPNRVTGAGFWKATGTDRPIYSSDGASKCIGLKKSLVFYRGRAAKGIKTDWMMHEFRLPTVLGEPEPDKKVQDKSIPPNEAWAICRIFKKTNSTTQRAISHSWVMSASINSYSPLETPLHRALNNLTACKPSTFPLSYTDFTNIEDSSKNSGSIGFGGEQQTPFDNFPMNNVYHDNELGSVRTTEFPFNLPEKVVADEWKINMAWDSPPGPSESTTYSTK
uniref:NAC domain-containing protein n=1 Tax=Tanacetum cinerariifolium TaxID=118510 RepID=A0A6L2JI17_TANCI|nr:hypothetical protein [Tanacetum cinerariifolium]